MTCFNKPRDHTQFCAWCSGHVPAFEHVHFGHGCANLCKQHARQVKRSAARQHRTIETTEIKGQQALPLTKAVRA